MEENKYKIISDNSSPIELIDIDREEGTVNYLGYLLDLTKSEYAIFIAIFDCGGQGIAAKQISEESGKAKPMNEGDIAVHIHNINQKSQNIGLRNLILQKRGEGYFINPNP